MLSEKKNTLFIYLCICAVTSVFGAVSQTLLGSYIEPQTELYIAGTALPTVLNSVLALCVLILASAFVIFRNEGIEPTHGDSKLSVFASALCGFFFIACAAIEIYDILSGPKDPNLIKSAFLTASVFLAFPSALYFFKNAAGEKKAPLLHQFLSLFPILWCISYLICTYFDTEKTMNSPIRIFEQLMLLCIMIFFLSETKLYNSQKGYSALYISFSLITVLMVSAVAIPNVALVLGGARALETSLVYSFLHLGIMLYALSKIICQIKSKN